MKDGKPPGVDNITAEILKHGGPCIIDNVTVVCQNIWTSGQWPKDWGRSLIIPLLKQAIHDFVSAIKNISLICYPSKAMSFPQNYNL